MKSLLKAPGIMLSDIDDVQATGETISAAEGSPGSADGDRRHCSYERFS